MKLLIVNDAPRYMQERSRKLAAAVVDEFENVKRFDAGFSIEAPEAKKFEPVKDAAGQVVDYRDVSIKGYLSTFEHVTKTDRQGDYVEPGAFSETIVRFMKNPVMLRDHVNSTEYLVGSFTKVKEDKNGLAIEGLLSNAPGVRDLRFKVAEGHLKTLSMGGIWYYKDDGRGIFKAELWEGSLTPIPANPDAVFETRSLNTDEREYLKTAKSAARLGQKAISYFEFLRVREARNLEGVTA